jgi:diguanylate cyclase (GGDEF)-like protein
MEPLGPTGVLLVSVAGVAGLGFVDQASGAEISFSIFYVLPVSAATWFAGIHQGIGVALVSAATWLYADLAAGARYSSELIPFWNTLVRLGYFLVIARLLSLLRGRLAGEEQRAETDALTGLRNALGFREALAAEHARATRYRRPLTLAYLDLDDFKTVNDTRGHAVGDQVLRDVADALSRAVRRTDVVGRLGGDEFAALLPETDGHGAEPVLAKIREAVREAMTRGGWSVGASVGAVTFTAPPPSVEKALAAADRLMYEAKRAGKDQVVHRVATEAASVGPAHGGHPRA